MPPDTPINNGRVTIAVLGAKLDNLTAVVLRTNATVDDMRREQGEMRQAMAVNEERWRNHKDLHKRERSILGALSVISSTVSGTLATWWASR